MNSPSRANQQPDVVFELKSGFRIRFFWIGDRFGHQFESETTPQAGTSQEKLGQEAYDHWIVRSVESDSSVAWPSSPPWQQVVGHDQAPGTSSSLLAVGLSGRGHWSAAIDPVNNASEVRFDVACRTPVSPTQLGCKYQVARNATLNSAGNSVIVTQGDTTLEFEFSKYRPVVSTAERSFGIEIATNSETWPTTFTWNYTIRRRTNAV